MRRPLSMVLKPVGHYLAVFYRVVGNPDEESPPYPVSAGAIDALFGEAFETVESFVPTMSYASRPFGAEEVRLLRKRSF